MTNLGYKHTQGEHNLFVKYSEIGGVTAFLLFVDDIIVTNDDGKKFDVQPMHG